MVDDLEVPALEIPFLFSCTLKLLRVKQGTEIYDKPLVLVQFNALSIYDSVT